MIKNCSKKYLIAFTSTLFAGIGIAFACAWGSWSVQEATNYTPEVTVDKKYAPFFYSYDYYYGIVYDDNQNEKFNELVANDWYNFLGKKYALLEIETLLCKT